MQYIDPLDRFGARLQTVEKPARYVGGEFGRLARRGADFNAVIAFPDLYEIGMSNQALRIIYNALNRVDGISCDRAFAPAPDFEALLRETGVPLYGLDTGAALGGVDLLLFTLGYELGITGVLTMLDLAGVPLRAGDRGGDAPVVIMGGPCVSNPLPFARFVDAFWIGEAEAGFFALAAELRDIKVRGGRRGDLLERLAAHPSVWAPAAPGGGGASGAARRIPAVRAVDRDFSRRPAGAAVLPVPNMKIVFPHGAVEIMRGCPNGCRFCHAGYWYRPMRQKPAGVVRAEAAAFVSLGGYREISLSSLSTGDYAGLGDLVDALNREFAGRRVSFQLPSLRVSTFSLDLLDKIAAVRRSGLTFAVETPGDFWQMAINKRVSLESVVTILREARARGWRGAKFYFMIGLPVGGPAGEGRAAGAGERAEGAAGAGVTEERAIVDFVLQAAEAARMRFNVNVGTFIPKPHTPFQWAGQLGEDDARSRLAFIRDHLKSRGHKVGTQDPFVSTLEGIISRGDERVGEVIEEAWRRGCRLDAWTEHLNEEAWRACLEARGGKDFTREILGPRDRGAPLPWEECVEPGMARGVFGAEWDRAERGEITSPCTIMCTHPCGICRGDNGTVQNIIQSENPPRGDSCHPPAEPPPAAQKRQDSGVYRILFSFSKNGPALWYPHLAVVEIFSMAMLRAGIPVAYSGGFNPLPRLEIASPLALGVAASAEIAAVETDGFVSGDVFVERVNRSLPEGLRVEAAQTARVGPGVKKRSLMDLLWGGVYEEADGSARAVAFREEKAYRQGRTSPVRRLAVLARDEAAGEGAHGDYFTVFRRLYP